MINPISILVLLACLVPGHELFAGELSANEVKAKLIAMAISDWNWFYGGKTKAIILDAPPGITAAKVERFVSAGVPPLVNLRDFNSQPRLRWALRKENARTRFSIEEIHVGISVASVWIYGSYVSYADRSYMYTMKKRNGKWRIQSKKLETIE